jgi:hypothetical protein
MGDKRGADRILVERSDGNRQLGRPRLRRGDNIKNDLQDLEWGGMDWIDLAEYRDSWQSLVNAVMNCRGFFFDYMSNCHLIRKDFASWSYQSIYNFCICMQ